MSNQKLAAIVMAAATLFSTSAALAETLRVGSETVYPPFEYLDSQSGQSDAAIEALQREYDLRHTEYAREILKRITEV